MSNLAVSHFCSVLGPVFMSPVVPSSPEWFQRLLDFSISPSQARLRVGILVQRRPVSNFWTTNPSKNFSWLGNKLLKLRTVAYPLIHLQIQNGENGRFWIDNWSPYGKLHDFLEGGRSRLVIPLKATLASLYRNGTWRLPAARTENQLQVLSFITTINFNGEPDQYMLSLPVASSTRSLILLRWQATIYWICNERNNRLHANQFRSVDSIFSIIDHQIRNKIHSFRETNPWRSSEMMQRWFR
uniref:Reverse transcriptase zinc-binding domain-containing protein n=1 Tax=Brassica oleracea TaxID=3712 RepID=A0A3P6DWP5_BRAOL|nr:unnamed protein product [Brassica oleracea]